MSIAPILRPRILVMFALALILAVSAYGFAAANTVSTSGAGDGNAAISGYTVGGIAYTLNGTNPANIDTVDFTITPTGTNPQPSNVQVQLITGGVWFPAVHGTGTAWSVDLTSASPVITATNVDNLRVVAAQ
jgi:hypothetical protein